MLVSQGPNMAETLRHNTSIIRIFLQRYGHTDTLPRTSLLNALINQYIAKTTRGGYCFKGRFCFEANVYTAAENCKMILCLQGRGGSTLIPLFVPPTQMPHPRHCADHHHPLHHRDVQTRCITVNVLPFIDHHDHDSPMQNQLIGRISAASCVYCQDQTGCSHEK